MSDYVPLNDAELEDAIRVARALITPTAGLGDVDSRANGYLRRLVAEVRERRDEAARVEASWDAANMRWKELYGGEDEP